MNATWSPALGGLLGDELTQRRHHGDLRPFASCSSHSPVYAGASHSCFAACNPAVRPKTRHAAMELPLPT